mgnify:FL=1
MDLGWYKWIWENDNILINMMDSYFPWSKVSQSLSETFRALPVALSVDLQKIESLYYSND